MKRTESSSLQPNYVIACQKPWVLLRNVGFVIVKAFAQVRWSAWSRKPQANRIREVKEDVSGTAVGQNQTISRQRV